MTAAEVNRQVRATNVDLGGGRGEVGGQEQTIRTLAGARSVAALGDARIMLSGGREVRLKDLGRVVDDASEQRSFGRLDGQPRRFVLDLPRRRARANCRSPMRSPRS